MDRIIVKDVSKTFMIGSGRGKSVLEQVASIVSGRENKKEIKVLDKVSFSVKEGEILGIMGPNGAGKSTILRIIAGIYEADSGEVIVNGKVISLINLGIGLQSRLSMRDNIHLCCYLFGLGRKAIKERFDSIVKFADLEKFVDTKLYQFSNGMLQRLAFSIAIHCDPDILLLDEVFEVGDEAFREKSAKKIKELVRKGASVVLVSHEKYLVKKYCHRKIVFKEGTLKR